MKICIDIPGTVNHGMWSPERGESRWAQNWATFLAHEGNEVIALCSGTNWGSCPPIKNISLVQLTRNTKINCDIYMNAAWWKGKEIGQIDAKVYIHLGYGFEPHLNDLSFMTKGHVIACPYVQTSSRFFHEKNILLDRTFVLPIPIMETFKSSAFNNSELTYAAKDVFIDRYERDHSYYYLMGFNVVKVITEMARKYSLKANFLLNNEIRSCKSPTFKNLNIEHLMNSIPNSKYDLLPLGSVYQILSNSKMTFGVISPGASMIESVAYGIVPLLWEGSIFDIPAKEENVLLNNNSSFEEIYSITEKLLTDEIYYNNILCKLQKELVHHSYSYSRIYWNKILSFLQKDNI